MNKPFTFLVMLFAAIGVCAQEENLQVIIDTAKSGYMGYLDKIPVGQESFYGFNNRDEFAVARIGKPYKIYTLSQDFFNDASLSESKDYLIPTYEWRIPITVNGEYRILLTVAKMNNLYQVVGIGGSGLAKELGEFENKYPSTNQEGQLLRVYQLECDFILSSSGNPLSAVNVYPMTSAKMTLDKSDNKMSSSLYSLPQVLLFIKTKINNK
jgi:hypothetical protein